MVFSKKKALSLKKKELCVVIGETLKMYKISFLCISIYNL